MARSEMADFDIAVDLTLKWEGGLVNNPADPGGITNFGISLRAYPQLGARGIRDLTTDSAKDIYQRDFWRFDGLTSQAVANKIFDTTVNLGTAGGIALCQRAAGVVADGRYGALTQAAFNNTPEEDLLAAIRQQLVTHYNNIVEAHPQESAFLKGWLRRANS